MTFNRATVIYNNSNIIKANSIEGKALTCHEDSSTFNIAGGFVGTVQLMLPT